jgi:Uma2 family endonuclease
MDRASPAKHEYMFGEMIRVPGGSPRHSLLCANACVALGKRLSGSRCRVFDSSLRACLEEDTAFYVYPDVTVVEGQIECLEYLDETVINPKLVVEVVSPASRDLELGGKARMYIRVPSLTDLLMIDQGRVAIEHWVRRKADRWDMTTVKDRNAVLKIESINCAIPVGELYAGVELPTLVAA